MKLTQDSLHHLLEDLSSFIQTFLFVLGILLIITPLVLTFSPHDWALLSTPRPTTPLQLKCHHLYKRFCHYSHMWILVALEELGVFGLLDTLFYWFPLSNDSYRDDDASTMTTSLFPSDTDYTHLTGGTQQQQQTESNRQFANVCIRGPENTQDYPLLVSGLVNTGNTCYLNSVLQALSSLPRLQVYLDNINNQYINQHLPVTRSLYKTLRLLSRPLVDDINTKNLAFRPVDIVSAVNVNHRVINREQQDAHELFQLLSGALENEGLAATKGNRADKGLKHLLSPYISSSSSSSSSSTTTTATSSSPDSITYGHRRHPPTADSESINTTDSQHNTNPQLNNPLTGLLANRLSCTTCGYTEAIRHFSFNNIQLNLPQTASTTLYGCLEQLTAMEYLDDVSCRKCSMNGLVQRMGVEVERLQQQVKLFCNNSEKRRETLSTLVQVEMQRRELIHQLTVGGSIQDEQVQQHKNQKHVPYQVHCGQSTKQVMVAKPPKVLCLHISRSTFHPTGVIYKNKCQLEFPEYLDMDQFCTNGTLLTSPNQPISQQQQQQQESSNGDLAQGQTRGGSDGNVKYKLMSIIVHYGSHSCGHFIAYKRRVVADDCGCDQCGSTSQENCVLRTSGTWYRISDENVDMCTIDEVLQANPYMLLYELIDPSPSSTISNNITKPVSTTARILISTENNNNVNYVNDDDDTFLTTTEMPPISIIKPPSTPLSASISTSSSLSSSSSSTALSSSTSISSSSSSSATNLPPSPSNPTELLAVSPSSSSSVNQKHHHQPQQQHLGSNHLVHRNKDRRKLDWQESIPPLVIY